MNKIPIFVATDDNYAKYAAVVLKSISENTSRPLYFCILCNKLSGENKNKLKKCVGTNEIDFPPIDLANFKNFKVNIHLKYITIETCFRYLIPQIKPEFDKAIYLDCDVVNVDDISKLFDIDISEVYAGVVPISKNAPYWCAGVMLLNCKKCRENNIVEKLFKRTQQLNGISKFLDQDALNDVFGDNVKYIDFRWQIQPLLFNTKSGLSYNEICSALENAGIVHLCGNDKPWDVPYGLTSNPFAQVFFHYLRKTPYFEEENLIKRKFNPMCAALKMMARNPLFFIKRQFWLRQKFRKLIARKL